MYQLTAFDIFSIFLRQFTIVIFSSLKDIVLLVLGFIALVSPSGDIADFEIYI
jgi:hypothetical protein